MSTAIKTVEELELPEAPEAPVVHEHPGDFQEVAPEADVASPEAPAESPEAVPAPTADAAQEISRILPDSTQITLSNGVLVNVERLRTRQFLKLLKILTRGAGTMLMEYRLDGDLTSEEFQGRLIALVGLSIPEAEEEAIDFLKAMTVPVGLKPGTDRQLSDFDKKANQGLWAGYEEAMVNPDLDDLINIIELVVRAESGDMQRIGKRLGKMMSVAMKTSQ